MTPNMIRALNAAAATEARAVMPNFPMRLHHRAWAHAPLWDDDVYGAMARAPSLPSAHSKTIGHAVLLAFDRVTILLTGGFND